MERAARLHADPAVPKSISLFGVDWFHRPQSSLRTGCPKASPLNAPAAVSVEALSYAHWTERVWDLDITGVEWLMDPQHLLEQQPQRQREFAARVFALATTRRMFQLFSAPDSLYGVKDVAVGKDDDDEASVSGGHHRSSLQGVGCARGSATGKGSYSALISLPILTLL